MHRYAAILIQQGLEKAGTDGSEQRLDTPDSDERTQEVATLEIVSDILDVRLPLGQFGIQHSGFFCRRQGACRPVEQIQTDLYFQLGDGLTDGRLSDAEFVGSL